MFLKVAADASEHRMVSGENGVKRSQFGDDRRGLVAHVGEIDCVFRLVVLVVVLRLDLPHQLVADLDLLGVRFAVFRLFRFFLYGRKIGEACVGVAVKFEGEQFPVLVLDLVEDGRFILWPDHDRRHLRRIDVFFRQRFHLGKRYVFRDLLALYEVIDWIIETQHGFEKETAVADSFTAPDQ